MLTIGPSGFRTRWNRRRSSARLAPARRKLLRATSSSLALLLLLGCGQSNAAKELAKQFQQHQPVFDELRAMASKDTAANDCFSVGEERVRDYFKRNSAWITPASANNSVALPDVLKATGLTLERYAKYTALLASIPAVKATYCRSSSEAAEFHVLISSQGFCDRLVGWSEEPKRTGGRQPGGDFHDVALLLNLLLNTWFSEIKCS